jgi:hypothetical protein
METLQSVVLPNLDLHGDDALYVRLDARASCERSGPRLRFLDGGTCTTDTFYGGLDVATWKQRSPVRTLSLEVSGEGRFVVAIGLHRIGHDTQWLAEHDVHLSPGEPHRWPFPAWDRLQQGMLFLRLRARGPAVLERACWRTEDPPMQQVRLGMVITHFNRLEQVLPAVERLRRDVLQHPEFGGSISLTVVDNSDNLPLADGPGLRRIASRNLGGSGGFARGLLELESDPRTTHVLFMDDDASCEGESVLRSVALLRHSASPRLAVAGALLSEAEPWRLMEKGACFDGKCVPLHHGRDLRDLQQLLLTERHESRPDYGGWWFFAFPVAAVEHYPFPFFVRGDDVFFSLDNRFEIHTLNGIACLGEEFRVKHGPMTAYLDARYHLVHALLRPRGFARAMRRLVSNQFVKPLCAYHYASARAFTLALRHVRRGPGFFREQIDLAQVRKEIAAWQPAETLRPVDRHGLRLRAPRPGRGAPLRQLLRIITLQGFLLPRALLKDRVQVQEKAFYGRGSAVFGVRRVLYHHPQSDLGYIAEHDRARFFGELRGLLAELARFLRAAPALRRAYAAGKPALCSRRFWAEVHATAPAVRASVAAQTQAAPCTPAGAPAAPARSAAVVLAAGAPIEWSAGTFTPPPARASSARPGGNGAAQANGAARPTVPMTSRRSPETRRAAYRPAAPAMATQGYGARARRSGLARNGPASDGAPAATEPEGGVEPDAGARRERAARDVHRRDQEPDANR